MNEAVTPSPSATVILARAGAVEPEVFMARRHADSSFGDAYAFPGGAVEQDDAAVADSCEGMNDIDASARLGIEQGGLAFYSAAIRETFEESGVLLADYSALDENLVTVRDGLNDNSVAWADFVSRSEIRLQCDQLHYFAHWITPPEQSRRFTTRFFLAKLPFGQEAEHCGGELTDSQWTTANEMLVAGRSGEVKLHFPTIKTLESIARHKSLQSLIDWAASSVEWGVTTMLPMLIERNGRREIVLPGDKDYPGHRT